MDDAAVRPQRMEHLLEPRLTLSDTRSPTGVLAVAVTGDLDIATAPRFFRQVCELLDRESGGYLELDLSGVGFCDLTGLRAVQEVADAAAEMEHQTWITAAAPSFDAML